MTAPRTTAAQRRENRREEILQAAQDLFLRKGYSNTSLDDIARAVGIKREGLYYYFPNRPQILIEIIKPLGLQLRDRVREIRESDVAPDEKMRQTVENHLMRFETVSPNPRLRCAMTISPRTRTFSPKCGLSGTITNGCGSTLSRKDRQPAFSISRWIRGSRISVFSVSVTGRRAGTSRASRFLCRSLSRCTTGWCFAAWRAKPRRNDYAGLSSLFSSTRVPASWYRASPFSSAIMTQVVRRNFGFASGLTSDRERTSIVDGLEKKLDGYRSSDLV